MYFYMKVKIFISTIFWRGWHNYFVSILSNIWEKNPWKPDSPLCPQSVEFSGMNIWSQHYIFLVPLQPVLSRLRPEDSMMPLYAMVIVDFGASHVDCLTPQTVHLHSHHHASLQRLLMLAYAIKVRIVHCFQNCIYGVPSVTSTPYVYV